MRLCIFHTQHTRALSSMYGCICILKYTIHTCILIHAKTCFILLYQNISHNFCVVFSLVSLTCSARTNLMEILTECQTSRPMNFISLISLFYKICTFITEAIGIHIHAYMHVCMHAYVCTYIYVCMPARVYEFFGTEKPNFPFTRR